MLVTEVKGFIDRKYTHAYYLLLLFSHLNAQINIQIKQCAFFWWKSN